MQTRMLHLLVGVLVLVVFLLTGYYMRFHLHHLMEENERLRFSMRGNHIYILMILALTGACLHSINSLQRI
jgi:hypothetical protein